MCRILISRCVVLVAFTALFVVHSPLAAVAKGDEQIRVSSIEEFAKLEGVIKRPSGLLIKVIRHGEGGIISPNRQVRVHYEGRLADGTVFDSSYERGAPATFGLNDVIRGWREAVLLMRIGSKWEVAIPEDIGYGDDSFGPIPPNADLFFTIELMGIQ